VNRKDLLGLQAKVRYMKVDNFALTHHQSCPAKYDLRINQDWVPRRGRSALGFGGAFHHGVATWYRTKNVEAAMFAIHEVWPEDLPVDDYRTKTRCMETMADYAKEYPAEAFSFVDTPGGLLIEQPFCEPTGLYLDCNECNLPAQTTTPFAPTVEPSRIGKCENCTGHCEEIEYGGIFDGLVEFSGQVYVLEHKTTSQMGPMYFNQFRPNNQVTGYIWGAGKLSGLRVAGAIINAIAVTKTQTRFAREITNRHSTEIDRWLQDLHSECRSIQRHRREDHWPMRTTSCTQYGLCEFHNVHVLPNEEERLVRLETDYTKSKWDFEKRDD
jgi:hypothetical protein